MYKDKDNLTGEENFDGDADASEDGAIVQVLCGKRLHARSTSVERKFSVFIIF